MSNQKMFGVTCFVAVLSGYIWIHVQKKRVKLLCDLEELEEVSNSDSDIQDENTNDMSYRKKKAMNAINVNQSFEMHRSSKRTKQAFKSSFELSKSSDLK